MFALPETMPEPTSTVTRSGKFGYHQQVRRDVTTSWVLNPEASGLESEPKVVVTLTTSHWGDRKKFSSTLTWGTEETRPLHPADGSGTYTSSCWSSNHLMKTVHTAGVARYSVKAMEEFHQTSLAQTKVYWGMGPEQVFEQAAEMSGLTQMQEV